VFTYWDWVNGYLQFVMSTKPSWTVRPQPPAAYTLGSPPLHLFRNSPHPSAAHPTTTRDVAAARLACYEHAQHGWVAGAAKMRERPSRKHYVITSTSNPQT